MHTVIKLLPNSSSLTTAACFESRFVRIKRGYGDSASLNQLGSLGSAFVHQASPVSVDISGFTVIKMFQAVIDALVEKEVIPEVFDELI